MKQLIFLFLIAPVFLFAQAPDYDYNVFIDGVDPDTTYTLEITDNSNVDAEWAQVKRKSGLTLAQVRNYFYLEKERILNQKGGRIASTFINDQYLDKLDNAIQATGGNYATWSQAAAQAQSTFSGIYQYTVIGTPTNVEVRIEGLNVLNNANNNQLGTLTGDLSRQWMNVQTAGGTVTLTSFGNNLFVGRNGNGQVVVLRKTGEIAQEP